MRAKLLLVPVIVLTMIAGLAATTSASTRELANTTVTIRAQGTDLSGQVRSPAPNRCANNRNVIVFKQIGPRGGGNDVRFANDTASFSNGAYRWSTGNTGTPGRFYAHVFKTNQCKGASSVTIQVNPT